MGIQDFNTVLNGKSNLFWTNKDTGYSKVIVNEKMVGFFVVDRIHIGKFITETVLKT